MQTLIYTLLNYINCSIKKDTNYDIAKTLLIHLKEVPNCSLEELAALCHVSDSTLHRFFKLIGYKNYKHFRQQASRKELKNYPQIYNFNEKQSYLQHMNENMRLIEVEPIYQLDQAAIKIMQADNIYLLGYGEFQYPALYFQKQLYSHGKLSEIVAKVNFFDDYIQGICPTDLIIVTSINGQYLHLNSDQAYYPSIQKLPCTKILITQSHDPSLLALFDIVLFCGKYSHNGLSRYAIMRIYERLIDRFHNKIGENIYE
ncbi:MAG: MurR/RpiR family transcriptional regulator [Beduini sp.]|uniref:MurR/RpiR family transcriptional regulator n=1 Tax=Beduini sp. TaxID=1922300 RepID=UPI00399F63FF